jgi:hypothetical protein
MPIDGPRNDSIGALQNIIKAHISTITKQALISELGDSRAWILTTSHRTYC